MEKFIMNYKYVNLLYQLYGFFEVIFKYTEKNSFSFFPFYRLRNI